MGSRLPVLAFFALFLVSSRAEAWPADLSQRIARDALRIVPKSLAEIFLANELEIFADARTSKMPALSLVYSDLPKGRLSAPTKQALALEFSERVKALRGPDFRGAVIALGHLPPGRRPRRSERRPRHRKRREGEGDPA